MAAPGARVMVTGVSRHLGSRLAQRLEADPDVEAVIGVDTDEPEVDLERTQFVHADIRNPLIAKTIQSTEVDTLVHLSLIATPTRVGGRSAMKEINVIGSLQLFAAAQKSPLLRRVVVKSTTAVYGASAQDPAFFTEDMRASEVPKHGYAKDAVEVARAARDFGRRRPDVTLTILRFANFMGSQIETPLTRYFSLPVVPTPFGYDPRIQFIHEDDAVEVLYRAVRDEHPGIYNVAGDGALLLSQAVRLCGRLQLPVPTPLATPVANVLRRYGAIDVPSDQLRFLIFGRVVDNERLKRRFGYIPVHTSRSALEEFIGGTRGPRLVTPERADRIAGELYALLTGERRPDRATVTGTG
jgi:UDP-glucose 4-epimerase